MSPKNVDLQNFNRFIFIPTWRCQLKCSYCDYDVKIVEEGKHYHLKCFGNEFDIYEELHWAYWLASLARFRPYHLSLTGGEPTLWNGLPEFIEHLPRSCSWDITSNTLIDYTIDHITPSNIRTWTASYHFHHEKEFLNNIKLLRERGFPVTVTLVLTRKNAQWLKEAVKLFNKNFFRCNIHKMLKQGHSWKDPENKAILDDVKNFIKEIDDENLIKIIDLIREDFSVDGAVEKCQAGMNYGTLFPDGRVYRCYSHALSAGQPPIGHIKDFKMNATETPCEGGCTFPCDIECQHGEHLKI